MSRPILFGVSSNEAGWQAAVHTVVHRIGRHFGFQAFNKDPQTSQGPSEPTWTPATIFLVTDHLYHLLVKNYMRRDTAPGTDDDCFGRAVFRLHDAIFQGYRDWCEHVVLPPVLKELALETLLKYGPVVEWEYLLEELALYFLIYSESANVRHTPEALWFVFWLLRNSRDKFNQVTSPPPGDPRSAAFATHSDLMRGLMKKRCHLRNKYQAQIKQWRGDCGIKGDGDHVPVADLVKMHAYARHEVLAAGLFPSAEAIEVDLLAELVAYGDSGPFLDRVVTPIFGYLAIQVDKMGSSGREIATRVTYDDCNESLCSKEVVHKVLGLLGVKIEPKSGRIIMQTDPYDALLAVGQVSLNVAAAAVAGTNAGASPARESSTAEKKLPGDSFSVQLGWDWKAAREWWARFVFGKTYVERRSVFTMYRTFYRIWAFFILEFQVMSVLLWGWGSWYALSSVCLTHAGLSLLEQMAGAWTQRAPVKGLRVWGNPFWGRFSKGIVDWLAINTVLWLCLVAQLTDFFSGVKIWWYVAAGYTGLVVAHAVLSTRDGYCISISHSLAAMFRRWARANSCCCGFLWRLLAWFWTRVGASSARPPPKLYLAPYQMRTGWDDFLANVVFWACVIAAKFAFDWFAVMKTLEAPVLGLWNRNWLSTGSGNIWINGKDTGIPKPDGDFILCIARCMPGFLVMFNDMQVFYYVVMAVFGAVKGLVQLNLGSITTFQELVISFHKAPFRWWEAGVSKKGASNILRAINAAAAQSQEGAEAAPALPPMARRVSGDAAINDMIARRNLDRQKLSYTERLIQTTQDMAKTSESKKVKSYFSDDNIARWLVFSDVWNAVVEELRAVDLVSDSERDNLCFVHLDIDETIEIVEGMRPFMLPIFFYGGQINRALEVPGVDSGQHVALTEIRALLVWLLLQLGIVDKAQADAMLHFVPLERPTTLDHRTKRNMGVVEVVKFLKGLQAIQGKTPDDPARRNRWATAQGLHENLAKLCDILLVEVKAVVEEYPWGPNGPTDSNPGRIMHGRAAALKEVVEQLRGTLLDPWSWSAFLGEQGGLAAIYAEAEDLASKRCISKVVRHLLRMLETSAKGAQPRGDEAQRILSFFMSSLKNPTLGTPPSISEMLSFNTLTPHYEEDVIYALNAANVARHFHLDATAARGLADLVRENEDGISVMQWLKSVYQRDWQNLMERLKPKLNGLDPRHVTEEDFDVGGPLHHAQMELLLWASYRGQLLARTVRGMMAYENALRLLAHLENPKPANMADVKYEALVEDLVRSKFTYVVASQVYAANRNSTTARGRWLARGIDLLLHQYPGLRVAYIDTQYAETGSQQYSVLIRGRIGIPASDPNCTEELYRIRLPQNRETNHGVILGEGKPENQNAAIIFCFGEIIQAIDMNQANYLCEALKMRNLVSEFNPPHYDNGAAVGAVVPPPAPERPQPLKPGTTYDVHATVTRLAAASAGCAEQPWPNMRQQPVCLVGFREWIFSQDSGALASFAAATEFTFGSMVQRVMTWPANVRFHYGHPDLWNKLFVMSRGGVSKATRAFHISEDVFAGYNHTLRGGKTKFKEYIQVGKGRDMGFDSINGFESKVAGGNGEQVVSRDVHRLGTQLDFFRLLAFYQSGPGFYINTYLVMLSVYANIWVLLLLALTDSQVVIDPRTDEPVSSVTGQGDSVAVQQIVQLGMFSIITYAVELVLEYGVVKSLATIFVQLLQGSIAFFIFRSRTSAYYFKSDVQYGGAKYISTGRGYALKHNSFVKVYTTYARSHLYFAMELVVMLVLLALVSTTAYASTTWSTWMVAVCILWSPFWFNPQTFQLERCKDDFEAWVLWMTDVTDTETGSTWYSWNKAQLEKPRNENLSQTNPYATALRGVLNSLPTAILAVAAVTSMGATRWNNWAVFGVATGGFWALVGSIFLLRSYLLAHYRYRIWRLMRTALVVLLLGFVVCAIIFIPSVVSAGVGFKNIFIIVFANLYLVVVCAQLLLYLRRGSLKARYLVDSAYRVMDWAIGYLLFAILFVLSFLQVFDLVQGALLFNMKFSKALQRARLLEANFLTSYVDRAMERIGKQVKEDITGGQQQQATPGRSPNVSPARPPGLPASPGMGAKSPGKAQ